MVLAVRRGDVRRARFALRVMEVILVALVIIHRCGAFPVDLRAVVVRRGLLAHVALVVVAAGFSVMR